MLLKVGPPPEARLVQAGLVHHHNNSTGTFEPKLLRTELFSLLVRLLQVVLLLFLPLMMLQFLLPVLLLCC